MVSQLQYDEPLDAVLLQSIRAVSQLSEPRAIAEQALTHLLSQPPLTAGALWLQTPTGPHLLAHQGLEAQPLADAVRGVITNCMPAFSANQALLPLLAPAREAPALGALVLRSAEPFAPSAQAGLQALASHLGLALAHAQLLEQIAAQRLEVAAADRDWDDFLSHAAHEIKNPLASIKGYADLMLRRSANDPADPVRKGLTIISQQVLRTTTLIEQLSDISRIGSERLRIDRHSADLSVIVRNTVQAYQKNSEQQHTITFDHDDTELAGRFDGPRVTQVVEAMLSNAAKFSPHGGTIAVSLQQTQTDHTPEALLAVSDTGVGIPEGEQERVFDRFFRASNIRGTFPGMGLGLFIAHSVVRLHGGRMWLESRLGEGTTCFAALPLA